MYGRVLFAYDATGVSGDAVPVIVAVVGTPGSDVLLVCVRDDMWEFQPAQALDGRVAAAVERLREAGLNAHGEMLSVCSDSISRVLLDRAREYDPDLVVLGSHGRGELAALLIGSVAHRVAAHLRCQVMIVREADRERRPELRRILLAIDRSPESATALQVASRLARERDAEVRVVHVLERVEFSDGFRAVEPSPPAASLVDGAVQLLLDAGVSASGRILEGRSIPDAIADDADVFDADLIVLGSQRHGSAISLLLGSVAQRVVQRTRRPVILAEKSPWPAERRPSAAAARAPHG